MTLAIADILFSRVHQLFPKHKMFEKDYCAEVKIIAENKIQQLIEESPLPWTPVASYLSNIFGENFFDIAFQQFPSYKGKVLLHQKVDEEFEVISNLCIDISLLVPFYTIYFEDVYKFNYNTPEFQEPRTSVLYSTERKPSITSHVDLASLQRIVENSFPGYTFVIHDILFLKTVDAGPPFGYTPDELTKECSLYAYLFGYELLSPDIQIAKSDATMNLRRGTWRMSPIEKVDENNDSVSGT